MLDEFLDVLLKAAYARAKRIPTPDDPAPQEWEDAADDFVQKFLQTNQFSPLEEGAAAALVPRLYVAKIVGGAVAQHFQMQESLGDSAAGDGELVEFLLVKSWDQRMKKLWLSGYFEGSRKS